MAQWNIDPVHSEVTFKVKHLVISTVTGRVYEKAALGKLTLDRIREWMGDEVADAVGIGGPGRMTQKADHATTLPPNATANFRPWAAPSWPAPPTLDPGPPAQLARLLAPLLERPVEWRAAARVLVVGPVSIPKISVSTMAQAVQQKYACSVEATGLRLVNEARPDILGRGFLADAQAAKPEVAVLGPTALLGLFQPRIRCQYV